jgi:hypothetical protein
MIAARAPPLTSQRMHFQAGWYQGSYSTFAFAEKTTPQLQGQKNSSVFETGVTLD